jgi:hypothetical protein
MHGDERKQRTAPGSSAEYFGERPIELNPAKRVGRTAVMSRLDPPRGSRADCADWKARGFGPYEHPIELPQFKHL